MPTLTIELDSQSEQRLKQMQAQEGETMGRVASRILAQSLGSTPAFSSRGAREIELINAIRHELPVEIWRQYRSLIRKLRKETLTVTEQEELLSLRDKIEQDHLARIERLIELSRLWNRDLPEVMEQLGVKPKRV